MIVRDFVVADSQLHHLCGVSASPRWLKNSQTNISSKKVWTVFFRPLLLYIDRFGGGDNQVGAQLLLRGVQRQLHCQHRHHCQLWVSITSSPRFKFVNAHSTNVRLFYCNFSLRLGILGFGLMIHIYSLFTSLEETRVMIGVYIIIGLSFAPNVFEYYQVISSIHHAYCVIKFW